MFDFESGSSHTAIVTMTNPTNKAFDYDAILYMGVNMVAMSTQSFHLDAGEAKDISLLVTMPITPGTYPVFFDVWSSGELLGHYQAIENVQVVPIAAPPLAVFEYTGIRKVSPRIVGAIGAVEVDIRNIGAISGVCHVWATIGGVRPYKGTPESATLNPGQIATFRVEWGEPYSRESPNIYSEAGLINYLVGEALCSVDIPQQIVSGSEYWATLSIYLKNSRCIRYNVSVYLRPLFPVPEWYQEQSLPACSADIANLTWSQAWGLSAFYLPLTGEGYFTIRGVYGVSYLGGEHLIQSPAIASSRGQMAYSSPIPLPPGIYEVVVEVRFYIYASLTATHYQAYGGWQIPYPEELYIKFLVTMGQVEII